MSNQKLKPQVDKYEIALAATIFLIFAVYYSIQYLRIPLDYSWLFFITIFLAVAFFLIFIVYHIDRESEWKRKQQSLSPYHSKNNSTVD